jgi:PAS domain S-box-containing protein
MPDAALAALTDLARRTATTSPETTVELALGAATRACRAAGAALCLHRDGWSVEASLPQLPLPNEAAHPCLDRTRERGAFAAQAERFALAAARLPDLSGGTHALLVWREGEPFGSDSLVALQAIAATLGAALARQHAQAALRESEARAGALLDTVVDAIITIDGGGTVLSFNDAAERVFGYGRADVVGRPIAMLMPEPYRSAHDGYLRAYHETGRRAIIGIGREVTGQRRDGTVFPMYLGVSEVHLGDEVVFTGIVRDLSEQRRLEQEVLRISDEERRRIGQDLHDGLGQMLTGVGMLAEGLARRLGRSDSPQADAAHEIAELIREADRFARSLARGLVPVELEQGGLRGALERLTGHAERLFGVACTLDYPPGLEGLDNPERTIHLYRVAQEAVSNAVQHGKAAHVTLSLEQQGGYLALRITDDGVGIGAPPAAEGAGGAAGELRGMGLRIMRYRARFLGAALDIGPAEGGGTCVALTLRLDARATPARDPLAEIS